MEYGNFNCRYRKKIIVVDQLGAKRMNKIPEFPYQYL